MAGVGKSFNGLRVLGDVGLELRAGEVHALLGGNGAGKSTLMKILEGVYAPDEGTIEIDGEPVVLRTPQDARAHGLVMIFQEFSLVPTLTVAQNIFLTREPRRGAGLLDDRAAERASAKLFEELGVDIDPRAQLMDLGTAYWQLTEICKALSQDARVLIMDEPTSSLARTEADTLLALVRRLRERGLAIAYISHRLDEVFRIADRVTVLRDGRVVSAGDVAGRDLDGLIEQIVGRRVVGGLQRRERSVDRSGTPLLEVRGLRAGDRVREASLALHRGEIVGVAGLMGSGRSELARALFGIDPVDAGEVLVDGRPVQPGSTRAAIAAGIALIPEDRRLQGLVLDHSARDNFLLPLLRGLRRSGLVDDRRGDALTEEFAERLNVRGGSLRDPVRLLSGGNQQKVVIGKWLGTRPSILILDEPTAGIDIGAKAEIVETVRQLADEGAAVLLISSEFLELLAVCDRVLLMRDGVVEPGFDRSEASSEDDLHRAVQGGTR
jgi:ribose transport system ATP-binding protein